MSGLLYLSWRHLWHHRWRSLLLALSLGVALAVPALTQLLMQRYDSELRARGTTTPLLLGPRGNRFDLALASLYWRRGKLNPVPWRVFKETVAVPGLSAVPLHVRFSARGYPIVATTPEYYERRGLVAASGSAPLALGDVTLGSAVAAALELGVGDTLFSDPSELYDISKPPAISMAVVGTFAPTGTPDDAAVFVDVKTAWVLEGSYHGHTEASEVAERNPDLVLGRAEGQLSLSGALIEFNRIDEQTRSAFHFHGEPDQLPLSAIMIWPRDHKAQTLFKTRVNSEGDWQVISPATVIDDLLAVVFRVKALFDRFSLVLIAATALLVGLVLALSARLRSREMRTLDRMGCAPGTIPGLHVLEGALLVVLGLALAAGFVALGAALVPDLVHLV